MKFRTLSRDEINKLMELDRTETIEHIYYMRDGKLVLEPEHWDVSDWSDASKNERIADLQNVFDKGATFFGAFEGDKLAGMSVLDHNPVRTGTDRLNLEGLWVSHEYRGKGVGKTLFQMAAQEARSRGAKVMYVSATPSENTVHFYQRLGCQSANPIDPTLFTKEPEDIHLELVL
ncbi:MAG: GNAT family N-acetyltransferase [Chloroflexi bacterium]|nr:MAG: GNAT family N-acetyltransferase [Chloroflexota bacterium]